MIDRNEARMLTSFYLDNPEALRFWDDVEARIRYAARHGKSECETPCFRTDTFPEKTIVFMEGWLRKLGYTVTRHDRMTGAYFDSVRTEPWRSTFFQIEW